MPSLTSSMYASTTVREFADDDIAEMLRQSREKNARLGVTGLFLHKSGQFMQVLEGDQRTVGDLLAKIGRDPRHRNMTDVLEEPIEDRRFPDWSMGFRDLSDETLRAIPGYSDFFDSRHSVSHLWTTAPRARWLMEWFRDH